MPKEKKTEQDKVIEKMGEDVIHSDEQTAEFDFEHGKLKGHFKVRNQNIEDSFAIMAKARKIVSKFGMAYGEDKFMESLAQEIATLDVLLIERPEWAKDLMKMSDWEVIHTLFGRVVDFLDSFRDAPSVSREDS